MNDLMTFIETLNNEDLPIIVYKKDSEGVKTEIYRGLSGDIPFDLLREYWMTPVIGGDFVHDEGKVYLAIRVARREKR